MRELITPRRFFLAMMLATTAFAAVAVSDVIVSGRSFSCQNTCVAGVTSSGGWYVYDSKGGWLRENFKTRPSPEPRPS